MTAHSRSLEIEKKYLLADESWRLGVSHSVCIVQGYICSESAHTVRVRIAGDLAWLTLKGKTSGCSRPEFEFASPLEQARQIMETFCGNRCLEKTRNFLDYQGKTWEIDKFAGPLKGLVVAEIELKSEDERFAFPPWLGKEVTHDHRFSNSNLSGLRSLNDLGKF